VISTVFLAGCGLFTAETPVLAILGFLLLGGFFRSLQFTALNALAFSDLDTARMSQATSFTSVIQQLSIAMGVALAAGVLEFTRGGRDDTTLVASDFTPAFLIVAAVSLMSTFIFARLPRDAGSEVSGHALPDQRSSRVDGSM
jgi:hypothetical protein